MELVVEENVVVVFEWQRGRKAEVGGRARVGWLAAASVSCPTANCPKQSNLNATKPQT